MLTGCGAVKVIYSKLADCQSTFSVDYVDALLVNGIEYSSVGMVSDEEVIGKKLGETKIKIQDNHDICVGYVMEDFDATLLPEGTPIYEYNGYGPHFRLIAGRDIYQVHENKKAKTMRELLDIEGKVEKINLVSGGIQGYDIELTEEEKVLFLESLLTSEYVGRERAYEKTKFDQPSHFQMTLKDGTVFFVSYYYETDAFQLGAFGTPELKEMMGGVIKRKNEFIRKQKERK